MQVRFSRQGIGRQRTYLAKLNKLVAYYVMFVALAHARFDRQFLAAQSFFGLGIGFFLVNRQRRLRGQRN